MGRRYTILLFLIALLVALLAASLQSVPGYMDAEYYYAGALRIQAGQAGSEPYLWNYLNDPAALPAPSFAYWMPLTSLLAALGLLLSGSLSFWAARLGFILLAAAIPPLTGWLAFRLTGRAGLARLAGLLALFSGFYLAYQTTTDAFPLYMTLGSLFLVLASGGRELASRWRERAYRWPVLASRWPVLASRWPVLARFFGLGCLVGLLHMTRADGLLWLAGAGLAGLEELRCWRNQSPNPRLTTGLARLAAQMGMLLLGYSLLASPWFYRNLYVWGGLFPPGGSRAIWITEYAQTMSFPAGRLTLQHWLSAGWGAHIQAWLTALLNYLQTAVAVQGTVILLPFMLIGLWKLRRRFEVRLGVAMWLVILAVMTFIFPYAGINGGFFHSGAALQPLLWAVAPLGIETAALWYAQKRRLSAPRTMVRFTTDLLVGVCALLTGLLYFQRVVGSQPDAWEWTASSTHYQQVERVLVAHGADPESAVLVNDPPGYWLASGRPAVVIPAGDEQTLLAAAEQFQAGYLVFERNNPIELADLYHERVSLPELEFLTTVGETRLYRFNWSGKE